MNPAMTMFAACLPGLESLLETELKGLGAEATESVPGGVEFEGELDMLYRANLCSGLATHVLLRLAAFPTRHVAQLRKKSDELPWRELFKKGQKVAVRATCKRSKLFHSGAVSQRVGDAIADKAGCVIVPPPKVGEGSEIPVIHVRVFEDVVSISLDTSGEPLHRRSWRLASAKAPLREDLAYALVLASGWDPTTPLVDPMMGSGTIVIEAAGIARRLPPGRLRSFAFEHTALCHKEIWDAVRQKAMDAALDRAPAPIHGSDRDDGAVKGAKTNAERAGVLEDLDLQSASFSAAAFLTPDKPADSEKGAVVSNPPYGRRVGNTKGLDVLYQAFGHRVRKLPPAWRLALCVADRRLALKTGLKLSSAFMTSHGGLKIRALVGAVSETSIKS